MRATIFAILASAGLLAVAPAYARQAANSIAGTAGTAYLTFVSDGCGRGAHRDRRGRCRANYDEDGALYEYRHFGRQFLRRHGYDAPYY